MAVQSAALTGVVVTCEPRGSGLKLMQANGGAVENLGLVCDELGQS
jgi:hypothetical protein